MFSFVSDVKATAFESAHLVNAVRNTSQNLFRLNIVHEPPQENMTNFCLATVVNVETQVDEVDVPSGYKTRSLAQGDRIDLQRTWVTVKTGYLTGAATVAWNGSFRALASVANEYLRSVSTCELRIVRMS